MYHAAPSLSPSNFMSRLLVVGCLTLLASGCAGKQIPVTTIHEDGRSTVFLETVKDKSFQAAHPITLDETTVANVLRGVHTQKQSSMEILIGKALRSAPNLNEIRTFFEDDIALLTPSIASALAKATPKQRVGFRLYHQSEMAMQTAKGQDPREVTAGYLSADGLSLKFTLTHYRYRPGKIEKIQKAPYQLPDTDGLRDRDVLFMPEKPYAKNRAHHPVGSAEKIITPWRSTIIFSIRSLPPPNLLSRAPQERPLEHHRFSRRQASRNYAHSERN